MFSVTAVTNTAIQQAADALFRTEVPKITAMLTRMVRDIGLAEEIAQETMLVALREWPSTGMPERPGAWLTTAAKRRALDYFRHRRMASEKLAAIAREMAALESETPGLDSALDDDIGDDLLRMIFTACHPILSPEARTALTLRLVGGLATEEIARAFLVPVPTIAQRIVRAKKTIADAGIPFEVPAASERAARLASVLEVIYLIFNEGYVATTGSNWMRPELSREALRLGGILTRLAPDEAEAHGLLALMEIQISRFEARADEHGAPILLMDQDRTRWDHQAIGRGLAALAQAEGASRSPGPYTLQAGIAACHARAATPQATDWQRIAALYDVLAATTPSPVVEVNRAVAHSYASGPEAGLAILAGVEAENALADYHLLPAVRGDLLARAGRAEDARAAFVQAASLARNDRERAQLLARARETSRDE